MAYCCCGKRQFCESEFVRTVRRFTKPLIIVFLVKIFHAYSYFMTMSVLIQYLSQNLLLNDIEASYIYTGFGLVASLIGTVLGMIIDELSIFTTILVGSILAVVARLILLFVVPTDGSAMGIALTAIVFTTLVPCAEILIGQSTRIGIKRYVKVPHVFLVPPVISATGEFISESKGTQTKRAAEYTISYIFENGAALLAFGTTLLIMCIKDDQHATNTIGMFVSIPTYAACGILACVGYCYDTYDIDEEVARREEEMITAELARKEEATYGRTSCWTRCVEKVRPSWMSPYLLVGEMGALFRRYLAISLILIGVKTLFRQIDATLPKYTQRAFDPEFQYAAMLMINPVMVIVFTPLLQKLLLHFDTMKILIVGTTISSLGAVVAMVPTVGAMVAFCIITAIGEMIWTIRYEDWVMRVAPDGQEGAFGAVAILPTFMGKTAAGVASGYLLDKFCSLHSGSCDSYGVWGSLAAFGLASPLLLVIFYRWIKKADTPLKERHSDVRSIVLHALERGAPSDILTLPSEDDETPHHLDSTEEATRAIQRERPRGEKEA